jgi:hypothetical protein
LNVNHAHPLVVLSTFDQERRIDLVRACFANKVDFDTEEDSHEAERIRVAISNELGRQEAFVRGTDKQGRAMAIIRPRTEAVENDDDFILTQVYNVERAIAASEYGSAGTQEMICVVFDFASFKHQVAPSVGVVKELVSILESSYSDRLKILIITDPPFWMRTVWGVVKPFVHPDTREKLVMAHGDHEKADIVGNLIEEDQAMPFLHPSGKLSDDVCVERFVKEVPFFCLYDEGPPSASQRRPEASHDIDVHINHVSALSISGTF